MIGLRKIRNLKDQIINGETRRQLSMALNNNSYNYNSEPERYREPIQPSMTGLQNVDDNPVVRRSKENCQKIINMPKKGNYFRGIEDGNVEQKD